MDKVSVDGAIFISVFSLYLRQLMARRLPTSAVPQVGGNLGYTGRDAT
jgi:hypothetical protein